MGKPRKFGKKQGNTLPRTFNRQSNPNLPSTYVQDMDRFPGERLPNGEYFIPPRRAQGNPQFMHGQPPMHHQSSLGRSFSPNLETWRHGPPVRGFGLDPNMMHLNGSPNFHVPMRNEDFRTPLVMEEYRYPGPQQTYAPPEFHANMIHQAASQARPTNCAHPTSFRLRGDAPEFVPSGAAVSEKEEMSKKKEFTWLVVSSSV